MCGLEVHELLMGKAVKELLKESGQIKDDFASDFQCFTLWCPRKRYVEKRNNSFIPLQEFDADAVWLNNKPLDSGSRPIGQHKVTSQCTVRF